MSDILQDCATVLSEAAFSTALAELSGSVDDRKLSLLSFEDATVIGFVVAYDNSTQLIESWQQDRDQIVRSYRDSFRDAQQKAWNAYLVLISRAAASFGEALVLGQIEENLEAMRKITKAGVSGLTGAHEALLPLLSFRVAPSLDQIDMRSEIRLRTSELNEDVVAAFLSNADELVVMQLLEDQE
ncbi:hypothetical protein ACVW1A_004165 [Bradyrhizobium sp. LB1.3]